MTEGPGSPSALLHLNPSSAQQIEFFASSIINEVKNGNESPLRVLIQLRAMEKASKQILDGIKDELITEGEKYPGKEFEMWGNKIEKTDVKTEYDYSVSGDTIWERLNTDSETAKSKLDDRQKFLRGLKEPMTVVDELTGEVVTIRPPQKKTTAGLKVYIR